MTKLPKRLEEMKAEQLADAKEKWLQGYDEETNFQNLGGQLFNAAALAVLSEAAKLVKEMERSEYFWFESELRAHPSMPEGYRCDCVHCGVSKALSDWKKFLGDE